MDIKYVINMTEEEKKKFVNTTGIIMLCIEERKSLARMAEELKLEPWEVYHDISVMLTTLREYVGLRNWLKFLFIK